MAMFSKTDLKRAADDASWERGEAYFRRGNVRRVIEDKGVVYAKVEGTHEYDVTLWVEDGQVQGECSCPMGDGGVFCKHCVAAGLAYLAEQKNISRDEDAGQTSTSTEGSSRRPRKAKPRLTLDDVRKYLMKQDAPTLVEMIIEQATHDERLLDALLLKTALYGAKEFDVAPLRRAIDVATRTHGFVDYHEAPHFCRGIEELAESITELITAGHPAEAIELAEHAIARCEDALEEMDDSDGGMGSVFRRLAEIHHAACVAAKPDPEELARRLFQWELDTDWDTFMHAAEDYADVLGEKGLAEYRRLAQKEWDKIPKLGPGQDRDSYPGDRFRITAIMESLARAKGDIEELVAVMSRDLSVSYQYLQIAEVYRGARQFDKAMEWAERGLADFPGNPDGRLRRFLADEYHRRRRHDEAMALIWEEFKDGRRLEDYKLLKEHADRAGQWPAWREKALACIRDTKKTLSDKDRRRAYHWEYNQDNSVLVSVLFWEGSIDDAWREAQAGGCNRKLWEELARCREKTYPADAIAVYKTLVGPIVKESNNYAYEEAFRLVRRICSLLRDSGREDEAPLYITHLRNTYKPKRNFMKMLDRVK